MKILLNTTNITGFIIKVMLLGNRREIPKVVQTFKGLAKLQSLPMGEQMLLNQKRKQVSRLTRENTECRRRDP